MNNIIRFQNGIVLKTLAISKSEHIKVKYPGFCTIAPEDKSTIANQPEFVSGIGIILSSDLTSFNKDEIVAFCGYSDNTEREVRVHANSLVKLRNRNNLHFYSSIAYVAKMFAILDRLGARFGDEILLISNEKEKLLFKELTKQLGIKMMYYKELNEQQDKQDERIGKIQYSIISIKRDDQIDCLVQKFSSEITVVITSDKINKGYTNIRRQVIVEDIGKGYYDTDYYHGKKQYPREYINNTVKDNMEMARNFIERNIDLINELTNLITPEDGTIEYTIKELESNLFTTFYFNHPFNQIAKLSDNAVSTLENQFDFDENNLSKLTKVIEDSINPFLMHLTLSCKTENCIKESVELVSKIIKNRNMKLISTLKNKSVLIQKFRIDDGSLVVINNLNKNITHNEIKCHVDNNTITIDKNKYIVFD